MKIKSYFTEQRKKYSSEMSAKKAYFFLSPLALTTYNFFRKDVEKFVKGKTIDAGGGNLSQKTMIQKYSSEYYSLDIEKRNKNVDFVADIQDMKIIDNNSFDSVICSQVLEHVPEPYNALKEIHRILKPQGHVIISVPHISGLHEEPHDYYRYTPYGIKYLMKKPVLK